MRNRAAASAAGVAYRTLEVAIRRRHGDFAISTTVRLQRMLRRIRFIRYCRGIDSIAIESIGSLVARVLSEKAAEDVGFYYAANAAGRLGGTLLSGLFYQWGGMAFCLGGSAAMLLVCWVITFLLPGATARARASAT